MIITEILNRIKFWKNSDRIGPDIPYSHWKLYFNSTMSKLCKKKFQYFGEFSEFRPGAYAIACSKISIGNRVVIRPGSMLFADPHQDGAGIKIEDDVMLGSGVHIYVNNHSYANTSVPIIDQGFDFSKPVVIKKGSWIGAKVIILPGVTIGENSVIGAGSIVTKNIPDRVVAIGNPARIIKNL